MKREFVPDLNTYTTIRNAKRLVAQSKIFWIFEAL